jgi:hypothetical protein
MCCLCLVGKETVALRRAHAQKTVWLSTRAWHAPGLPSQDLLDALAAGAALKTRLFSRVVSPGHWPALLAADKPCLVLDLQGGRRLVCTPEVDLILVSLTGVEWTHPEVRAAFVNLYGARGWAMHTWALVSA